MAAADECASFKLVGGTAFNLQIGHRESIDIDLFSDVDCEIDFDSIENYFALNFSYIDHFSNSIPGIGKSYLIGENKDNAVKLDIFYTDKFINPFSLKILLKWLILRRLLP
jgi:hypothetical protein